MSQASATATLSGLVGVVERLNLVLSIIAVAAVHLAAGAGELWYGVIVGGVLGILNLRAMVWLGTRTLRSQQRSRRTYALLFGTKLAILLALIWLLLSTLPIAPVGFVIGLATLMPAVLLATLWVATQPAPPLANSESEQRV